MNFSFRPQTTIESLAKLKPVFKKDGVVTAGSASVCNILLSFNKYLHDKGLKLHFLKNPI